MARLVFDRLGDLGAALTAAAAAAPSALPGSEHLVAFFGRWAAIAEDPTDPWREDPWVAATLPRLRAADARVQRAVVGSVPAHTDLRADNVLVAERAGPGAEPAVWFVDWAASLQAAGWVDRPSSAATS